MAEPVLKGFCWCFHTCPTGKLLLRFWQQCRSGTGWYHVTIMRDTGRGKHRYAKSFHAKLEVCDEREHHVAQSILVFSLLSVDWHTALSFLTDWLTDWLTDGVSLECSFSGLQRRWGITFPWCQDVKIPVVINKPLKPTGPPPPSACSPIIDSLIDSFKSV